MRDVGERSAVNESGRSFQRLDHVGVDGVFEHGGQSAAAAQLSDVHRLSGVGVGHYDVVQSFLEVVEVLGQAENGHDL